MTDENLFLIEDLTIKDNYKINNNIKINKNYDNQMDSLFKELDFRVGRLKDLYNLEYKRKNIITKSKQVSIDYTKKNNLRIHDYNPIDIYRIYRTDKVIDRILKDKSRYNKNNKHKRTQSSLNIKNDIVIELKAVKTKPKFEIMKFELFIENKQIKNNYPNYFINLRYDKNGDIIIEEEPQDINQYYCLPFSQILNNCNPPTYLWELFPQEISANQLEQNGGTCYMVSALESLSHIPKLLNYIFDTNFSSNNKTYQMNFRQYNGTSEHYIVKNNFPTECTHNLEFILKFMKPLENEAYGIIFEKVWAVIRGGYKFLDGGHEYDVLNKLLGTNCTDLYNKNMGIFSLDINAYAQKMNDGSFNNIPKMSYQEIIQKVQEKQESDKLWIQKIINIKDEALKIEPKKVFELIKNSQKNYGAIITTSINVKQEIGHAYSILGVYSKKNPKNNKIQDFVILKNPWRAGNYLEEKIDIIGIENQIRDFPEIIKINNRHYNTGVFYMPREYYEKWFRNIVICKPNYQKYFPEVFNAFNLYKEVANYYKINSQQSFFDITQGQNLIKTDVISKQKYESLLKLIQPNNSAFTYAYDKNSQSTIWYDGKYMHSLSDSVFVKDNKSPIYNLKKSEKITQDEFYKTDVYKSSISYVNKGNKYFSVIKLKKVNRFEELFQTKKNYNNINNNSYIAQLNADLSKMDRFKDEIKEFLRGKYTFVQRRDTNIISDGWVNCFPGINLVSENYEDKHYHVYNLGKNDKINLFTLIGKIYKCSCYYFQNNHIVKYCNKHFTFQKQVKISDFTYYINCEKKVTPAGKCDTYNIEIYNKKLFLNY